MIDLGETIFELNGREMCLSLEHKLISTMRMSQRKDMDVLIHLVTETPVYEIYYPIMSSIYALAGVNRTRAQTLSDRHQGLRDVWSIWDYQYIPAGRSPGESQID